MAATATIGAALSRMNNNNKAIVEEQRIATQPVKRKVQFDQSLSASGE